MENKKSIFRNPGIILSIAMIIEAAILYLWWPKEVGAFGVAKVNWLIIFTYFVYLAQCVIYIPWIEKLEADEEAKSETKSEVEDKI